MPDTTTPPAVSDTVIAAYLRQLAEQQNRKVGAALADYERFRDKEQNDLALHYAAVRNYLTAEARKLDGGAGE